MYIVQSHATISALDYKVVDTKYSINITFLYQEHIKDCLNTERVDKS